MTQSRPIWARRPDRAKRSTVTVKIKKRRPVKVRDRRRGVVGRHQLCPYRAVAL